MRVCRSKHVEPSINFGIINLVGISSEKGHIVAFSWQHLYYSSVISLQMLLKQHGPTGTCLRKNKDPKAPQCYVTHTFHLQGGSNMTGTDLCVNMYKSVPVIFEPTCININQSKL
jgi:hypothetical protein